jgi:EpsI family protein
LNPLSRLLGSTRRPLILIVVLVLQAIGVSAISREERLPDASSLATMPTEFHDWVRIREGVIEPEILEVLRADDVLTRIYRRSGGDVSASLFIAYFESQRDGKAPHSPKNCLPGSGWTPSDAGTISLTPTGTDQPIEVNRYVVAKGTTTSIVLYWYQSRSRVVASEYLAKLYLVLDSLRYHRTDTAIIRITTPVADGDVEGAEQRAVSFAADVAAVLPQMNQFR